MFTKSHKNGITTIQQLDEKGNPEGKPVKIRESLGVFLQRLAEDDFVEAVNNCQS